jgi:hypothetical protein
MLTPEQKSKLEPLTHHEKYGKLLIEAMKTWETTTPKQKTWGVTRFDDKYNLLDKWELRKDSNECCLIGASMIEKSFTEYEIVESANDCFKLDDTAWDLICGFDSFDDLEFSNEANKFGRQVADMLFK